MPQTVSTDPRLAQRRAALARAMEVRTAAARLKRRMRAGRVTLHDAMLDPTSQVLSVETLLEAMPGVGPMRIGRILRRAQLSPRRRVRELNDHQRARLEQVASSS